MKKIYLKYSTLFISLITVMVYFFFVDTEYKPENLLPFFVITIVVSIGLYFLFQVEKNKKNT